jgi:hypothetical protein
MTYREFFDEQGQHWEVWEIRPISIERRLNEERRRYPRLSDRRNANLEIRLRGMHRDGWLTFQCGNQRRRLVPIPDRWDSLEDSDLVRLLQRAAPLGRVDAANAATAADRPIRDASRRSLDEVPSDGGSGIQ